MEKQAETEAEELKINVSRKWVNLIIKTWEKYYYGQICFKTAKGGPVGTSFVAKLTFRPVRFDRDDKPPARYLSVIQQYNSGEDIGKIQLIVSKNWIRLINWVQTEQPDGQVCVTIINGDPIVTIPSDTHPKVQFDDGDKTEVCITCQD